MAVTAAAGVRTTAPTGDEVESVHCNPAGKEPPDKTMEQVGVEPARTLFEQERLSVADCAQSGRLKSADRSNFFMLSPGRIMRSPAEYREEVNAERIETVAVGARGTK
jgi:hypothetical protein